MSVTGPNSNTPVIPTVEGAAGGTTQISFGEMAGVINDLSDPEKKALEEQRAQEVHEKVDRQITSQHLSSDERGALDGVTGNVVSAGAVSIPGETTSVSQVSGGVPTKV